MPNDNKKRINNQSAATKSVPKKPSTSRPKDPVKSKAGKASAAARKAKREKGGPVARPCKARRTNGEPCKNSAIRGGTVCARHGGSAPQVRAKANRRLIEMVLPAMSELHNILHRDDVADADKLKAIQMVLNRTGYSERHSVDIGLREPTPFDNLTSEAFVVMRGPGLRKELEDMEAECRPEFPTPNHDLGDGVDEALEAFLDQRERARQREASTHLDNSGHEVVTGEVHQQDALDPFRMEERRREEWERSATEYDPRAPKDHDQRAYEDRLIEQIEETERRTGRKR
jgi:hypothetical protein